MFDPEKPPELSIEKWLNSEPGMSLKSLHGKVVVVAAFHVACEGSQEHGVPQAIRLSRSFERDEVQVVLLHTGLGMPMTAKKVAEFVAANEIMLPVAIDASGPRPKQDPPQTMETYTIRGTPSLLIFDRQGRLRRKYFGQVDDFRLGAEIMAFAVEDVHASRETAIAIESRLNAALTKPAEPAPPVAKPSMAKPGKRTSGRDPDPSKGFIPGAGSGHVHSASCGCGPGHDRSHGHQHGPNINLGGAHDHDPRANLTQAVLAKAARSQLRGGSK